MTRSENMSRIRSKDTAPEMAVRTFLHALGYRYRLHRKELPGNPDIVFPSRRKVIFIHGCYWHAHDCSVGHVPKSNVSYWSSKLERNAARDAANGKLLRALGWKTMIIWECQVRKGSFTQKLKRFLG